MVVAMAPRRKLKRNQRLMALRARLGLTQAAMAKKLGVTLRGYQNFEANGTMSEPVKILLRLIEQGVI